MKLSDSTISHMVQLLQMAIMTGTDITDNFRMLRLVSDDGVLNIDPEYQKNFDDNMYKMIAQAESLDTSDDRRILHD